jgi:hypothetical protein
MTALLGLPQQEHRTESHVELFGGLSLPTAPYRAIEVSTPCSGRCGIRCWSVPAYDRFECVRGPWDFASGTLPVDLERKKRDAGIGELPAIARANSSTVRDSSTEVGRTTQRDTMVDG